MKHKDQKIKGRQRKKYDYRHGFLYDFNNQSRQANFDHREYGQNHNGYFCDVNLMGLYLGWHFPPVRITP